MWAPGYSVLSNGEGSPTGLRPSTEQCPWRRGWALPHDSHPICLSVIHTCIWDVYVWTEGVVSIKPFFGLPTEHAHFQ